MRMTAERAPFFDTHAHLDFPDFRGDLPLVLERAAAAGIHRILSIATDLEASRRAVALAEAHEAVYAAAGWHPGHADEAPADLRPSLRALAAHPKVVAIGECGLDYYRLPSKSGGTPAADEASKQKQHQVFLQQLEVAAELRLNLVVHTRDSFADTLGQFSPFAGRVRAVFHCFIGNPEEMRQVLDLDCLVSFTGIATFKNAAGVRETIRAVPLDRLMLETDCPFLAPTPHRGKRCEPAFVAELAALVAEVKGVSLQALSDATCATARAFFPKLR